MLLPMPLGDACDEVSATVTVFPQNLGGDRTPPRLHAVRYAWAGLGNSPPCQTVDQVQYQLFYKSWCLLNTLEVSQSVTTC